MAEEWLVVFDSEWESAVDVFSEEIDALNYYELVTKRTSHEDDIYLVKVLKTNKKD